MDLARFEDAGFQDLLERARLQATDRADMLGDMGRFIQQTIALLDSQRRGGRLVPRGCCFWWSAAYSRRFSPKATTLLQTIPCPMSLRPSGANSIICGSYAQQRQHQRK